MKILWVMTLVALAGAFAYQSTPTDTSPTCCRVCFTVPQDLKESYGSGRVRPGETFCGQAQDKDGALIEATNAATNKFNSSLDYSVERDMCPKCKGPIIILAPTSPNSPEMKVVR